MSRRVAPEGEAPCTPGAFPTGEPSLTWRDAPEDAPLTTSARWKSVAPEGEAVAFPDSGEPYVTWRDAPEESLRPKSFGASRSSISTASELIQESGAGSHPRGNPIYQSLWDAEFRQQSYSPGPIRILATVTSFYNVFSTATTFSRGASMDQTLAYVAPRIFGAAVSMLFLAVFCMTSMRLLCARYYDHLGALWTTLMFVVETVFAVRRDIRTFESGGTFSPVLAFYYQNISFGRLGWFVRECTDADPERTLLLPPQVNRPPGCSSYLTGSDCLSALCSILLVPVLLEMDWQGACATTIISLSAYVISCMSVGYLNWSVFWSFMLQMAAGVSATLLCRWSRAQAKNNYAKLVAIRFATRTSQDLVHTLIPPGVMEKFSPDKNLVCTAQSIDMSIVMFCMFEYNVLTRDDFDWIESFIANLDQVVEQSGMFKYQHISCVFEMFAKSEHFKSVSQGLVYIKGKGQMEVYDISLNEPAAFHRRQSASRVAVTRTRLSMPAFSPAAVSIKGRSESVARRGSAIAREEAQLQACETRLMSKDETQWQAWLEERHSLSRFMRRFRNAETEQAYQKSSCFAQRRGLTMGFLFHLVVTSWQWSVITLPDQGPIFHHHGNLELIWRMNVTQALLAGQFVVSIALSCLAFVLLGHIRMGINAVREFCIRHRWISAPDQLLLSDEIFEAMDFERKPQDTVETLSRQTIYLCDVLYVMLKSFNVAIFLSLGFVWPVRINQGAHFSLYFLAGNLISHSIFGASFVSNTVLVLLSLPATVVITSLALQKSLSGLNFAKESEEAVLKSQREVFIATGIVIVASVCASRFVGYIDRMLWSREQFCSEQLEDIHKHLVDLVPPFYVNQLLVGCRHIECSPGRVAVLQLDVCNFTVISTSLQPTKLADIINSLVSDFDKYVVKHSLTKIDTIGDAYIVVVWLEDQDSTLDEDRIEIINAKRCISMLKLADGILSCLAQHREKTGIDLNGRIGVATGDVISGVLGLLQPQEGQDGCARTAATKVSRIGQPHGQGGEIA